MNTGQIETGNHWSMPMQIMLIQLLGSYDLIKSGCLEYFFAINEIILLIQESNLRSTKLFEKIWITNT